VEDNNTLGPYNCNKITGSRYFTKKIDVRRSIGIFCQRRTDLILERCGRFAIGLNVDAKDRQEWHAYTVYKTDVETGDTEITAV